MRTNFPQEGQGRPEPQSRRTVYPQNRRSTDIVDPVQVHGGKAREVGSCVACKLHAAVHKGLEKTLRQVDFLVKSAHPDRHVGGHNHA